MLNFGHTISHALETNYKYSNKLNHGEAISIGMITKQKYHKNSDILIIKI